MWYVAPANSMRNGLAMTVPFHRKALSKSSPNTNILGLTRMALEPLTGRFDGENYNIGLVSGTDTPYGELVAAARQIQSEVYARKH